MGWCANLTGAAPWQWHRAFELLVLFNEANKVLNGVEHLSVELEQSEPDLILPLSAWMVSRDQAGFHHSFSSEIKVAWERRARVSQPFSRHSLWKGSGIQASLGWKAGLSDDNC